VRLAAALLPFLIAAAPASAADKPVPLTRESVRKMPDEELARRVFGDLGHVMYPQPRYEPRGARDPMWLRGLEFVTRPRGSYRAGVCETDSVHVGFEPLPFTLGDDPPVRPYRFDKYENFFIQDFSAARSGDPPADEEAKSELDSACREIDPRTKRLIAATTAFEVVAGLGSLAALIEAAKKGRALAPLECKDRSGEPVAQSNCLVNLSHLDPLDLYRSAFVDGCNRKDPQVYCRSLKVHDFGDGMDIDLEYKRGGEEPLRIQAKPSFDESSLYP
jgi:hypothetical protein